MQIGGGIEKKVAKLKHRKQKLLIQRTDHEKKEKESNQKFLDKANVNVFVLA